MADGVGWLATAVFASSYFCKQATTLRRVQAVAALLWATYGVLIHALPIIVANVIVASLAIGSSLWRRPLDQG
jgi:Bacterial inner membrane protein